MFTIIRFLALVSLLIFSLGCAPQDIKHPLEEKSATSKPPETITITAVGDMLMHIPIVHSAKLPQGGYDFKPIFAEVEPLLSEPDLTIANLETRLAGSEFGYSGYPMFNTPESFAQDLKDIGIDVVTTANNHSLDRGWQGLVNTLNHLDAAGLGHVGNYRTVQEADRVYITNVKGLKIAILNYTESTNGIPLPKGKEFSVNLISPKKIYQDIDKCKENQADLIVACLHFGTEYQRHPNEYQKKLVDDLFQRGVDIIFGNHVHVIQPMELRTIKADTGEKNCFVVYSLGNFVSNQGWRYSNCGLIVNVTIEKNEQRTELKSVDYVPVWVHSYWAEGKRNYRVLPVQKAIEDYESGFETVLNKNNYNKLLEVWQDTTSLITESCPVITPRHVPGGTKI